MTAQNPFIYSTPDQISDPQEALNLFVDVFKDFRLIESVGNTFVNGARGSGKSMMFRVMRPDCLMLRLGKPKLEALDYFAVYVPIKDTSLAISELDLLSKKHGEFILNENLLCIYFGITILKCLSDLDLAGYENATEESVKFYKETFVPLVSNAGYELKELPVCNAPKDCYTHGYVELEIALTQFIDYIKRLALGAQHQSYDGPIFTYRSFLLPLIESVRRLVFFPRGKPMYLLVDDADLLNRPQTQTLNSWVSFRSTASVCFKISTQLNYKSYYTTNTQTRIDSPHDYHEINLSDVYTSDLKGRYKTNLKAMVEKRLYHLGGIDSPAESFFPRNEKQHAEFERLFESMAKEHGYDFAYRNASLDYMLGLTNRYSYSYAGFEQLVHLSSGIVRNFIDLAFKMYDRASKETATADDPISEIPVAVQDDAILEHSTWVLGQLEKTIQDGELPIAHINKFRMLKVLLDSMGKAFRMFMESKSSERKKFSFYFDGEVSREVSEVLRLGVSEGLLHQSTLASKTGLGRSSLYVMNRILAPIYQLEPFSFTGYLNLTAERVEQAARDEKAFLRYIRDRIASKVDEQSGSEQTQIEFPR